ncbi:MAG TPA: phosphatase PAP2 family protein [Solirubrobacteraceae bacterium]|nr:phosphatase PAP2 family protein [Solirubrobacteraceae bacterium]
MAVSSTTPEPAALAPGLPAGAAAAVPAAGTSSAAQVSSAAAAVRPRWWGELLIIAWLAWLYDIINDFAPVRVQAALAHGRGILRLEHSLGISPELALNRWLSAHQTLGAVLSYYYDNAHFAVTFGLLGWLWLKRADIYRPLRNSLVAVNLVGMLVFWRYPVAPPRLLASSGFTDVVAASHTLGSWHTGSLAADADQYGAMPSLHIAWAVWCTLVVWRLTENVPARVVAVLYPCLTAFAVLATGNHYLLDLLGGLATLALALLLARAWSVADVTNLLRSRRACTLPGGRHRP